MSRALLRLCFFALLPLQFCAAGDPSVDPPAAIAALAKNIPVAQVLGPKPPAGATTKFYGRAVAVSDKYLVIGAPDERIASLDTTGTGVVYVFERNTSTTGAVWKAAGRLTPFTTCGVPPRVTTFPDMDFGAAVAVYGNTVVVGAPSDADDNTGVAGTGSVFVFIRNSTGAFCARKIVGSQIDATPTSSRNYGQVGTPTGDAFGSSVAAGIVSTSTSLLIVPRSTSVLVMAGAPGEDQTSPTAVTNVGAVSFFSCSLNTGVTPNVVNCPVSSNTPKIMPSSSDVGTLSSINFGSSVAIGSSYALVGAPGARSNTSVIPASTTTLPVCPGTSTSTAGGAVYAYSLSASFIPGQTVWSCRFKIGNPSPSAGDLLAGDSRDGFGFRIAASGSTMVVGVPGDNSISPTTFTTLEDTGSARVFKRTTSSTVIGSCVGCWGPSTTLRFGSSANDKLGSSVAFAGGRIVVGAPGRDISSFQADRGSVYLFEDNRGSFVYKDEVFPTTAVTGDAFGTAVGVGVGGFVGGAPNVGASDTGLAYWFAIGTGGSVAQLQPGTLQSNTRFADSTAIGGNVMVVGHPNATSGGFSNAGEVQIFLRTGSTWTRVSTPLRPPSNQQHTGALFGFKVDVSGDGSVLVASAPDQIQDGTSNTRVGAVFLFQRASPTSSVWNFVRKLTDVAPSAGAGFGKSLSISPDGSVLFIGSPDFNAARGRLHVFRNVGPVVPKGFSKLAKDFDNGTEVPPPAGSGDIGDKWGGAVATDGESAAVGTPGNNGGDGSVSVMDAATATVDDTVNAPADMNAGDQQGYGSSVDVDDGMVVGGAPTTDTSASSTDEGVAYAYSVDASTGDLGNESMIQASQGSSGDKWGTDVATSDGSVGMGAPSADVVTTDSEGEPTGTNADQGAVNLYQCTTEVDDETGETLQVCEQSETVTGEGGNANDGFGTSIDMNSGEDFVVGAPTADTSGNNAVGAAYTNDQFESTPDMSASAASLPTTGMVNMAYNGSIVCTNIGGATADAASCSASGLPTGLGVSNCQPGASNQAIAAGNSITCAVSGTPSAAGTFTATVSTTASVDSNSANNSEQASITISAQLPDIAADASGLPVSATQNSPYSGTYSCANQNGNAANNVACSATGLPAGLSVTGCTPTSPANLAGSQTMSCTVSGTPTAAGSSEVTVTASVGGNNDADLSNNSDSTSIMVIANVPDMSVSLAALPLNATVGANYSGSLACSNVGGAQATAANCALTGLPSGITVGTCTPVVPNATVAAGASITCPVSGTPTGAGNANLQGSTSAPGDTNTTNNTAAATLTVLAAAEMAATAAGLPTSTMVGEVYAGTIRCDNRGASAALNATCGASGLPAGLVVTGCTIGGTAATLPASVPAGSAIICAIAGSAVVAGTSQVTVSTDADNDVDAANNASATQVSVLSSTLFGDGFE
jgi:hypothetical protein